MESDVLKAGKFRNFLRYARNHRIPIRPETRKIGIVCTLIGWACISFITTTLPVSTEKSSDFSLFFNFLMAFLAGTVFLFVISLFSGVNFLKIIESTENKQKDQNHHFTHLSVPERKSLIFWRSLIAVVGYMLFSWAKSSSQVIDNSAAFSTDAIMYALIMVFVLKMKISLWQWIAVVVVFIGVCDIVSFDVSDISNIGRNILSLSIGLTSAAALAIIILLNTVIIQHEPPLRVAFYQCLIGLLSTTVVVGVWMLLYPTVLDLIDIDKMIPSIVSGIIYAISLIFFFTAFLYTEPFLIAMLGYSVFPFVIFFSWITSNVFVTDNIPGAALIVFGGLASVLIQYRNDRNIAQINISGHPIYLATLKDTFRALRQDFQSGRLGKYEYMAERHEFNKLLIEYAEEIKSSEIKKIEIESGEVLFFFSSLNIKMLTDNGCRSVPFEILNFGSYEKNESFFVFDVVQDGDVIIDVGANLGWYSIQLAKRFPHSVIHSFEPIPQTFSMLEKNINMNDITNVILHNYALGKISGQENFFYFTSGSAIASRKNLLDHKKAEKIECKIVSLDSIANSLNVTRIDFLKCDVEGSELDVIEGGLETLKRYMPIIYIELYHGWCQKFGYEPDNVLLLLNKLGYQCFKICKNTLSPVDTIENAVDDYNFFFMSPLKHFEQINKFTM